MMEAGGADIVERLPLERVRRVVLTVERELVIVGAVRLRDLRRGHGCRPRQPRYLHARESEGFVDKRFPRKHCRSDR